MGLDAKGLRASTAVGIVTEYLVSLGIPREELDHIDTLVNFDFERSTPAGFRCHVFGAPVPPGHLIEVAEGLLVVDEVMCFVQAGSWMSEPEQLEYGYEICARYHLNHLSTGDYIEMGQRYTVADLIAYCNENRSRQGAIRAAAALKRVHDGARSPMETATAIMVVAKRSQGGLGYAKIELNHRVDVPNEFKYLAKAGYFEIDVYAPASGTGIEYNGSDHLDKQRSASDAERMTVLSALGFRMIVLTGTQFAHQLQLIERNSLLVDRMAPSKCYGTTAFALVTILVIFAMFASVSSCTDRARYSGGDDYLVFGAGSVHSIEGTELVIQTDNSPRYTDAGKQTRITFPSSGRIKDKLSQIKVGTRVSYSRFESVDTSGSYEGNDIEIEQANTIRRC